MIGVATGPNFLEGLNAVHDWHHNVQNHEVIDRLLGQLDRLLAVLGPVYLITFMSQGRHHDPGQLLFIFS